MWIDKVSFFYGISIILSIMHVTLQIPRDESVDLFWGGMLCGRMKPYFLFKSIKLNKNSICDLRSWDCILHAI